MEKDICDAEESICNYLYLFSSFLEYAKNSKEIFTHEFQDKNKYSLEKLKNDFRSKNANNEFFFLRSLNVLTMLKSQDVGIKEKGKNEQLKKIKTEFNIELSKKLNEEEVFLLIQQKLSILENIFINPILIQILAEKIYTYMVQSNNLFYYIFRTMKNKYVREIDDLTTKLILDNEKKEKKINELNSNKNSLQNEVNSLKNEIKKNNDELKKTKQIIENNKKEFEEKFQKKTQETEEKIKSQTQKTIESNKKNFEKKLQEAQQTIESNKKNFEKELQEAKQTIESNKNDFEKKLQEADKKIIELEKKIEKITSNAIINNDVFMLKYREVLDINLNYMIRDKDIKNIFKSYSDKIIDLTSQNNESKIIIEKLKIENDQKTIEIEDLRNYIKTIKLEISTNEKKNEIINDVQ